MNLLAPIGFPESPSIASLSSWSVLEVLDDDDSLVRLAVGWIKPTKLRITSPIEQFEGGQVLTRSGSVYTLVGPPATQEELREQATRLDALLGRRTAVDVTAKYTVSR